MTIGATSRIKGDLRPPADGVGLFTPFSALGTRLLSMLWNRRTTIVAIMSAFCIALHVLMRFHLRTSTNAYNFPLVFAIAVGGVPQVLVLARKLLRLQFGSDLLGGISIVTSVLLGEYLAGTIIVLMLAGGEALEGYALRRASSVLLALAKRIPSIAHRRKDAAVQDVPISDVVVGDTLEIYPHDTCPVDGVVIEGRGTMDESYLTGEPFKITKATGSEVISGSINGESVLTIRTTRLAIDSRYSKIMEVMRQSEATRPHLRRMGDRLGALYTPVALGIALLAWGWSGEAVRFLSVLVIATPCPLLIAIPISIIGSISLCARRSIIVKNPVALEMISECRTAIFDKTGTLTYGVPELTDQVISDGFEQKPVLQLVASLERYSKHPLAGAFLKAAQLQGISIPEADEVSEQAGSGLRGVAAGHKVLVTSRTQVMKDRIAGADHLPAIGGGLECVVVIDDAYAATFRFRDSPRAESQSFVKHLAPQHQFTRVMLVSGDRSEEVQYLADQVGITEVYGQQSPEQKLQIVRKETIVAKTLYVGDGINDAPAMMAATVGIAIGLNSDVTAEAASVVVMDNSLKKVDEFIHISGRMRTIALQSAVGGMVLSVIGMILAANGYLSPVGGALAQEAIDVLAILNALRAAFPPKVINDL